MAALQRGGRIGAWLAVAMAAVCLFPSCQEFLPSAPLVGIIAWSREVYCLEDNLRGIVEGLREEGFLDGVNLRLQVLDAREDREKASQAVVDLTRRGARLLITVGSIPTLVALDLTEGTPVAVVYSGVAAPQAHGLKWEPALKPRFTGTSCEVPEGRQLEMFRQALPRLSHLGLLWCTATPVAEATGHLAVEAARQLGLQVTPKTVPDDRPELVEEALTGLLEAGAEGLFLPADPVLTSPRNLQRICRRMQAARIPVMVPYGSEVVYGALISYHADFGEIGRQTGRQAARILAGAAPWEVPPEIPRIARLTVNLSAAQSLGLVLSRRLLSRAHEIY